MSKDGRPLSHPTVGNTACVDVLAGNWLAPVRKTRELDGTAKGRVNKRCALSRSQQGKELARAGRTVRDDLSDTSARRRNVFVPYQEIDIKMRYYSRTFFIDSDNTIFGTPYWRALRRDHIIFLHKKWTH